MSPPPLSWWRLLLSVLVVMMGMLWLTGAEACTGVRSSSESLLLELSSLLDDEELLESDELSPLLSWSMTRASAISSVRKEHKPRWRNVVRNYGQSLTHWQRNLFSISSLFKILIKVNLDENRQHITSFNVIHGGCRGCFLLRRRTLGAGRGLVAAAAVVTPHLLA